MAGRRITGVEAEGALVWLQSWFWSEEDEEQAALAVKGEWKRTGELLAKRRQKV